jgi:peptidoglycan/LPS O-acetylase OafA/YrhL
MDGLGGAHAHAKGKHRTMWTIAQQLKAANNRPTGFDHLRVFLSLSIIAWHTVSVCHGNAMERVLSGTPMRLFTLCLVPSFFALSGFLVAGSVLRNDLPSFITLRALRIYPALMVESIISAFILGPVVTSLPLSEYFQSRQLFEYLLNVIGWVHYHLPGVFVNNPGSSFVNLQLWTIPYELECYIAIAALSLVGLVRRPRVMLALLFLMSGAFFLRNLLSQAPPATWDIPGRMIVLNFLFGAVIYLLKDRLPHGKVPFAVAFMATMLIYSFPRANFLSPLPVAYMTVYLGTLCPPKGFVTKLADYSYGLYLYGYPVQQTVIHFFPVAKIWYFNFLLTLPIALALSVISWHLVEKPVLDGKTKVLDFVRQLTPRWVRAPA